MTTAAPICFGDVVKLNVKTPAGGAESVSLGFLEHKSDEFLLIVPPVKESASAKFQEAEFIVAPTRCEKPPALGTPLNYKQSFVLLTSSQFEDYSLNNKMNNNDTIGLQCRDVKGEMYLAIEKEGYTLEANVMDGDEGLDLVVVDSNRIRKQYNNKFGFYTKKSDVLGGYVSCGGKKNKPLSFTITKVADETKTKQFINKQIPRRRRSTLTNDPAKGDETTRRASRVGSDVSDGSALSPTGSMSALSPAAVTTEVAKLSEKPAAVAPVEAPAATTPAIADTQEPRISTASTAESVASASEASVVTPPSAPASAPAVLASATPATPATATAAPLVDLLSEVSLEEKVPKKSDGSALMSPMALVPEATSSVASSSASDAPTAKATKPAGKEESVTAPAPTAASSSSPSTTMTAPDTKSPANSKPSATASAQFVVPSSPKKLGQQPSALTVTSEAESLEGEKVDSNCLGGGQCLVM